jgi:hypothetical protein
VEGTQHHRRVGVSIDSSLDSPPPTPSLSPCKANGNGKSKADTPPSSRSNTITRKPGGRPPVRRGRLGRNQYTRDHPEDGVDTLQRGTSQDGGDKGSPMASGTENGGKDYTNHKHNTINGESGRSSKAKTHPARTNLNEMRRRVAAILEFVGRVQTERTSQLHGDKSTGSSGRGSGEKGTNTPNGLGKSTNNGNMLPTVSLVRAVTDGLKDSNSREKSNLSTGTTSSSDESPTETVATGTLNMVDERDFVGMGSGDMMEMLTRELVQWQRVYGVYSR